LDFLIKLIGFFYQFLVILVVFLINGIIFGQLCHSGEFMFHVGDLFGLKFYFLV